MWTLEDPLIEKSLLGHRKIGHQNDKKRTAQKFEPRCMFLIQNTDGKKHMNSRLVVRKKKWKASLNFNSLLQSQQAQSQAKNS